MANQYLFGGGRRRILPWLFLLPGLGFYLIMGVGPSLFTTVYSLTDATGLRGLPISWVGFDNYYEFLLEGARSRDNLDALWRTPKFMVLVTVIQFGVGLLMAILVNQKLRGHLVFRTIFFIPVILGAVVQGLMWKLFLRPGGGPMDTLYGWLGLESQFLAGTNAFYWVVLVQIWANAGFTMVVFLAGMQTIPAELFEAAAVDGARGWSLFKNIIISTDTASTRTSFSTSLDRSGLDALPGSDRIQKRNPSSRLPRLRRRLR